MPIRKSNTYLSLVNSYLIDSPQPSSINYWWNVGSLLGLCLVIQIASGIFLAMHYSSNIELAFNSVEHIMRDVNAGWLIRYIHANGASFFFICMYLHIGKALYYGSYKRPRVMLWVIGVIIFVLTMATAFMGYCLVYGQMSHWGSLIASNILILYIIYITQINKVKYPIKLNITNRNQVTNFYSPLNIDMISIIYGSLLGDGHAERRSGGKSTRICFYQESSNEEYLLYLHSLIANLGYCNTTIPKIFTRLKKNGVIRKCIRFTTWSYDQFNSIHSKWYIYHPQSIKGRSNYIKILPKDIELYLTPLALAIWIMDDGGKVGNALKLSTNNFTYDELLFLTSILKNKYNLTCSIQSAGAKSQYYIYIWVESMPDLVKIVKPYIVPCMKYKFGNHI